jgi:transcriptional regulator with XRE-family HTH domain
MGPPIQSVNGRSNKFSPYIPGMPKKHLEGDSFGGRVRTLRKARGWTQQDLAKKTKGAVGQSSISDIESGVTKVSEVKAVTILGLANAFGVNPAFLRNGKDSPVAPESVTPEEAELLALYRELKEVNTDMLDEVVSHFRKVLTACKAQAKARPSKTTPFRETVR